MSRAVLVVVILGAALLASCGGAALWFRRHPIETFVKATRRGLVRAGLARVEFTSAGATPLVYFRGGTGQRTMVLVHGVNDQAGSWSTVVGGLAPAFRLVAVDMPGHGESGPASGPLPMNMIVDALGAVIDRESPDAPVVLVGNSMGGWVCMLYAAQHPSRVSHLVLEDASGMMWDLRHVPAFPKNREEAIRLLRMVHGPAKPLPDYLIDATIRMTPTLPQARVLQAGVLEWLVDSRLPQLTMPVSMIWGADDGLLPLAYARTLQSKIPGATLRVIDGAAHVPHRQAPRAFLTAVREALP